MIDQIICKHEDFQANVEVIRHEEDGTFSVDIEVKCHKCGLPFAFLGTGIGYSFTKPTTNVEGTKLNVSLRPGKNTKEQFEAVIAEHGSIMYEMPQPIPGPEEQN